MNPLHKSISFRFLVLALIFLIPVAGGCKKIRTGTLIVTEAKLSLKSSGDESDQNRYYGGARIISFQPQKPGSFIILTEDFNSAAFPEISYDGARMLFTAQKNAGDTWQIWEMDLRNLKYRQITFLKENCTDPAYLPGGRIVFSKLTVNDTVRTAHCLFTSNEDGSDLRQITFSPCDNFSTLVMKDGRLLTVSRQLYPEQKGAMLVAMRPDGTKADMFYMNKGRSIMASGPRETDDGKILFIEQESDIHGGKLSGISYRRPLHTYTDLSRGKEGEFISVLPLSTDKYLISYRETGKDRFGLYESESGTNNHERLLLSDPDYDIIDIAVVKATERPKKLPSEVDLQVKTGLLLCQDINFRDYGKLMSGTDVKPEYLIEVLGVDTTLGIVPVEDDGSFQLKILSDKPFRIRTIDDRGNTVSGPCAWLWLRPNERRGCVGCHEDPETVPVNRIPLAVKKPPVIVPVSITEIKEKTVELE